jgi:hypothetical protein
MAVTDPFALSSLEHCFSANIQCNKGNVCTCNATLTCVREPLLPWKSNKCCIFVSVCVCVCMCARASTWRADARALGCVQTRACSLTYPVGNVHAPCCDIICGPSGIMIFFDILSETARFLEKNLLNLNRVLIFSTTLV